MGVVHQGERLTFGFETGDHLAGVHAGLDDLQGDRTPDRLVLHGAEDDTEAAFADLLDQLESADGVARLLRNLVDRFLRWLIEPLKSDGETACGTEYARG